MVTPEQILRYVEKVFVKRLVSAINRQMKLLHEKRSASVLSGTPSTVCVCRLMAVKVEQERAVVSGPPEAERREEREKEEDESGVSDTEEAAREAKKKQQLTSYEAAGESDQEAAGGMEEEEEEEEGCDDTQVEAVSEAVILDRDRVNVSAVWSC